MPKRLMIIGPAALTLYGVCVVSYYTPARAEQMAQIAEETWKTSAKVGDLDGRISRNEATVQALQGKVDTLDERLSKIETTAESSNKLIMGTLAGVILLLIKGALTAITRRRRAEGWAE